MHKISLSSLHGLKLWLAWNLATYIGLITSGIILISAAPFRTTYFLYGLERNVLVFTAYTIRWFLIGLVIGWFQSLVVGSEINSKGRWIWATAIGLALWGSIASVSMMAVPAVPFVYSLIAQRIGSLTPLLTGMAIGITQWLVLRQKVNNAGWWVVSSTIAWFTPIAILRILELTLTDASIVVVVLIVLTFPGVITGIALLYLFDRSKGMHARISAVFAILLIIAGVGLSMRPEVRLQACWIFSNGDGQILYSTSSPDGSTTINVVKVDCGQSSFYNNVFYDCSTRIDLQLGDYSAIRGRGYEWNGECDLDVEWLDNAKIQVTESSGEKKIIDVYEAFSILP